MKKSEKEIIYGKILYQLKINPSAGATFLYETMKLDYPISVVYYHYNEIKKIMHAVYNADKRKQEAKHEGELKESLISTDCKTCISSPIV